MKRISLIALLCITLITVIACGGNSERAKFSDDYATIHYGDSVYHEITYWSGTAYNINEGSPIKVGSFYGMFLTKYNALISEYDTEKNIIYADEWIWIKEGFEFPDFLTCRLNKIDAYSNSTFQFVKTIWENEEEILTLGDIVDSSNETDNITGTIRYEMDCYLEDYPYLIMVAISILYSETDIFLCLTYDFVNKYYRILEEYVPLFDF